MTKLETMSEYEFIDIFADNLRDIMCEENISQSELAKRSLLDRTTVNRYLSKERMPSLKAVVNIAHVLNCSIEDLIPTYDLIY